MSLDKTSVRNGMFVMGTQGERIGKDHTAIHRLVHGTMHRGAQGCAAGATGFHGYTGWWQTASMRLPSGSRRKAA